MRVVITAVSTNIVRDILRKVPGHGGVPHLLGTGCLERMITRYRLLQSGTQTLPARTIRGRYGGNGGGGNRLGAETGTTYIF